MGRRLVIAVLFLSALATICQAVVPTWEVSCTDTVMTIVATKADANSAENLRVDDTDVNDDGTDVNGCSGKLTNAGAVYTLTVNLALTAIGTVNRPTPANDCPANTWPASANDPVTYEKFVIWAENSDIEVSNPTYGRYKASCTVKGVAEGPVIPAAGSVVAVGTTVTDIVGGTQVDPVVSMTVTKDGGGSTINLEDTLTLSVSYSQSTYWTHVSVTSCQASSVSGMTNPVSLVTAGCPQTSIGSQTGIINTMAYGISGFVAAVTGDNPVPASWTGRETMSMGFKAFRFQNTRNVFFQCQVKVCPSWSQAAQCPIPAEFAPVGDAATVISLTPIGTCTAPNPLRRYRHIMLQGRNSNITTSEQPPTFLSTFTVGLLINDKDDVNAEHHHRDSLHGDHTCMKTAEFIALVGGLSAVLLVAVVVVVMQCLHRGSKARNVDDQKRLNMVAAASENGFSNEVMMIKTVPA